MGKASVLPVFGRISVAACFHGPEVIGRGDYHGLDAIENAFVMGSCPGRIDFGNPDRLGKRPSRKSNSY